MNLIPDLVKVLNFNFEEEFLVYENGGGYGKLCRFRFKGPKYLLEQYDSLRQIWEVCSAEKVGLLVLGVNCIKKLPFKPKIGDNYFFVDWVYHYHDGEDFKVNVYEREFSGCSWDYFNVVFGNAFRTYDEAMKQKYAIFREVMQKVDKHFDDKVIFKRET